MSNKLFWRIFSKRSIICFSIIAVMFFVTILRLTSISTSNYSEVQHIQSSLKLKISDNRGTIFDCNKYPITNSKKKIIAAVSPTPRAITAISQMLKGDDLENLLEQLRNGKPVTCQVEEIIECDGIICTEIYETDSQIPAIHTIGYTNSDNIGVSGIQKAYEDTLKSKGSIYIRYACDGKGRILSGITPEITNQMSPYSSGVVTTIDINIQKIAEAEADNLGLGAIVVADAKTSKIRAIVSRPNFTLDNIENALESYDSPMFNRALGAYNVGSIFKPCVAAAGCENGFKNFTYNCTGSFEIIDRTFRCHEHNGHGFADMNFAIANSCNTYFYNFAFKIGKNPILNCANALNFGKSIKICDNITTSKGSLPTAESLENLAHLANFSIGQGVFTASPVSMLTLYTAIANNGQYYLPSIVESTIENGYENKYNIGSPTKAFSEATAQKLKEALSQVITEGTGILAKPETVTAGGKTATAQTGKYENSVEVNSSWFCGFFPLDDPKYVIIVFSQDTKKQTESCAKIFAQIADKITALP